MASRKDLLNKIDRLKALKPPPRALLILSEDTVRADRLETMLLEAWFEKGVSSAERIKLDARDFDNRLLPAIENFSVEQSLFSPTRLATVFNIDLLKAEQLKTLQAVLLKLPENNHVILRGKPLPKRSMFLKHLQSQDLVLELPEYKGQELRRWVEKEFRQLGLTCESGVAAELCDLSEGSLDQLVRMIDQISLYCDDRSPTLADLGRLFASATDPNEFGVLDAAYSGDVPGSEILLEELFRSGENPFLLLGVFGKSNLRYLAIRSHLNSGNDAGRIRDHLGLSPWLLNKDLPVVKKLKGPQLLDTLQSVVETDLRLKGKAIGPQESITLLLDRIRARVSQ